MNPIEIVDLVVELEDEVNNGGFHQFFNNSSGDNTAETIQALEAIGATVVAEILKVFGKMVARDGIEPPTPAFSGLRSTI